MRLSQSAVALQEPAYSGYLRVVVIQRHISPRLYLVGVAWGAVVLVCWLLVARIYFPSDVFAVSFVDGPVWVAVSGYADIIIDAQRPVPS